MTLDNVNLPIFKIVKSAYLSQLNTPDTNCSIPSVVDQIINSQTIDTSLWKNQIHPVQCIHLTETVQIWTRIQ